MQRPGERCGRPEDRARHQSLCPDGAAHVDTTSPPAAHWCSFAQIERAIEDALRRFNPEEAEKRRRAAADTGTSTSTHDQVSTDGTVHVDADLDLADALDLNDAVTAGAAPARRPGQPPSHLNVRRSMAAGALARRELTLDF